ncbi:MAG: TonB-dependent receptor plug domain-containing protein [Desulfovibrio sp.]|uniref:TonB-dependent receptor n=1 Tax=Desulfovibrio sp. 7SRBS1 TaxID=3378064 RepID=UPI003B3E27F8
MKNLNTVWKAYCCISSAARTLPTHVRRTAFSAAVLCLLLNGFTGISSAHAAEGQATARHAFSIESGELQPALSAFAEQCGITLTYAPGLVDGLRTKGLHGEFTVLEGLQRLLSGTGLRAGDLESGTLPLVSESALPGETAVLPTVRVMGNAMDTHEIPMETVKRIMARDMADVFRNDPSVIVGGGARNSQRIYVRGVDATNLNVTIDGAKQGASLHQHFGDMGSLDPSLLKRVSVQTGSSADAGPGALGGSIRFETVDAQDLLGPKETLGASINGQYGSVDNSWLGGATAYALFDDTYGVLAHFTGLDRRNYRAGDDGGGKVENTAGDNYDYFLKLSMLDHAGQSLRLSAEHMTESGSYIWGGQGSDFGYSGPADPMYVTTERTSLVADHRYNPENRLIDSRINLYYNVNSVDNSDLDSKYNSDTLGGDVRNTFHLTFGQVANDLTTGVDSVYEERISDVSGDKTNNGSYNVGFYLQNRMSYGPARLSFGARLDSYDAEFGEESTSGSRLSPNIGLEFDVFPELTAFVDYGEAVRSTGILPGSWMANINANTKFNVDSPEVSKRYEGGLRFNKSDLIVEKDNLRAEWTYFDSRLENVITAIGGRGGVVREIMNSDPLSSKGWEARLGWGYDDKFNTSLGYTHVITRDDDGDPVSVTRRLAAAAGDRMVWDNRASFLENWTFGYTLTYAARLTDVPDGEEERPGYVLHGVQAEWTPGAVPGLTLSLAISNLFDRAYCEQTSIADSDGYVREEPGRDVRLGFAYRF